jgi:hypothetical protein
LAKTCWPRAVDAVDELVVGEPAGAPAADERTLVTVVVAEATVVGDCVATGAVVPAGVGAVAMIDFARKVDLVRSSAYGQVKNAKDKEFAKDSCDGVHKANWYRRTIAHSSFEVASGGGVQFIKFNKDGIARPVDPPWTETDFANRYAEMSALETELDKLIELIKPVPFGWHIQQDWDVPLQLTMTRDTPLALRIAKMNEVVEVPRP